MQAPIPDLFDVIHFEIPQIKQFYDEALKTSPQTPQKPFRILPIIASPFEFKVNVRKLDNQDLFNELLEQENKHKSPFSSSRPASFSYNISQVFLNEMRRLQFIEKARPIIGLEPEKLASFHPEPESIDKQPPIASSGESTEVKPKTEKSLTTGSSFEEVKKRKRKSNSQLKVLKLELEKETFWDKEKILQVSQNTGLSESQVYKWFWDQKKKKAEFNNERRLGLMAKKEDEESLRKKKKTGEKIEVNLYRTQESVSKRLRFETVG